MRTLLDLSSLSRRRLMAAGAVAAGAVGVGIGVAWASAGPAKMKQADVAYQTTPKGKQRCDACVQWQAPNACKVVVGVISPVGWCSLFAAKS